MTLLLATVVPLPTLKHSLISAARMYGFWLGSHRQLTRPAAWMMPVTQWVKFPWATGEGRFRQSAAAILRQISAYSSSSNWWQKSSVTRVISS